jgi:type IV fimbrial biogenesis protein FimT
MLKARARQRGLNLVEVMIAITVIGMLVALAAPSFSEWLQNQQIRAAAEATLNGLQVARSEAVRRNAQVRFQFVSDLTSSCSLTTSALNWVVSLGDPSGKCNVTVDATPAGPVIQSRAAAATSPNVQVAITPPGGAPPSTAVTFTPLGSVVTQNSDGSLPITQINVNNPSITSGAARPLRVVITAGGSVRMCDPAVTTAGDTRVCP